MSEPIYEYVKGQGWIPTTGVTLVMACGTVVRLESRFPENGEAYTWCRIGEKDWYKDDGPNLEFIKTQFVDDHYYNLVTMSGAESVYQKALRNRMYVTLVKI